MFRADASLELGSGHVMRCLTLADTLKSKAASCTFLCREIPEALAGQVTSAGHRLVRLERTEQATWSQAHDAHATLEALGAARFDWLVVDHYGLDRAWERPVRALAARVMVIDDLDDRHHDCDLLLDQNLVAPGHNRYCGRVPAGCRLLLGPRFALLRQEFATRRPGLAARTGSVRRVLISFGGADAHDHTSLALKALQRLDVTNRPQIDIVIGAEHPARTELEAASAGGQYVLHVQTARMAEIMAGADLAIGGGGTATWERCCMGLPSVVLAVAENQQRVVHDTAAAGLVHAVDTAGLDAETLRLHVRAVFEDRDAREDMSRSGMHLVDGRGAARVARGMGVFGIQMRPAEPADAKCLFEWRNHPHVRSMSRTQLPLEWEGHLRWLDEVLRDPQRVLLVGERAGRGVGVARFDIANGTAETSIYMAPERDPAVRGADLLGAAEQWLISRHPEVRELTAVVLDDNAASHALFRGAGFSPAAGAYSKKVN